MALDQDAVLRLLLTHRAMLVGYIGSIVRDGHLAEDIFQNVSLIVVKKGTALEDPAAFPAWARRIARFEALNALRREGKSPQPLDDHLLDLLEAHWSAGDDAEGARAEALRGCLEKLTSRSRQLIELRYRENVSGTDLARRLSQPLNTVYVALSRIHRALSACIRLRLSQGGHLHA